MNRSFKKHFIDLSDAFRDKGLQNTAELRQEAKEAGDAISIVVAESETSALKLIDSFENHYKRVSFDFQLDGRCLSEGAQTGTCFTLVFLFRSSFRRH